MLKGEGLKSGVLRKVERFVCDCVNEAFTVLTMNRYTPVSVSTLYEGVTNIPLTRRMARAAVFIIAHDRFGVTYSVIEKHSGISARNIMSAVRKYKDTPESDNMVRKINELIEAELKKFPII